MKSSRRDFLQVSASAASALTLGPLVLDGLAKTPELHAQNPAVRAVELKMLRARPVPLGKVRLTGGPLKTAQDVTATYLLSLEPDRMLAYYRIRAGLEKKAEPYGGWDGDRRNLTGHIAGHHLSGVSLMYLATGDARFKQRADVLVAGLKEVQDKQGDGYLGALEGTLSGQPISGRDAFAMLPKGDIRSGGFDLNGMWSPWYVLHKTFAGLRDAYRHTGNKTALEVEIKFATWAETLLKPLTEVQFQKMLLTEHGGMNEVLADLYADTGDRRWLDFSYRFEHHAFTDALKRHHDNLNGKHGNCQIPKLCGSAARYGYTGDPDDLLAATFFFDRVAQHHSYATGGHGLDEYFGAPDELSKRVDGRTAETCNVYNMIKLARRLFSIRPDAFYADFHERALFNHILGSIDPEDGRTSYMVPVGRGVMQEYQNMQQSFTCCVGSGMESHALHGDGLYYESDDTVWVNLYASSTAELASGAKLAMETGFPDGDTATLTMAAGAAKPFTLAIRRPSWAGDGFTIKVNGEAIAVPPASSLRVGGAGGRGNLPGLEPAWTPSAYVSVTRTWKTGDKIELALPKTVRIETTADDKRVAAIMWGPLCLAGDFGPRREGGRGRGAGAGGAAVTAGPAPIPALVTNNKPAAEWVVPAATPANFTAKAVARVLGANDAAGDVSLTPFYRTHRRTYSIYFDVLTPAEYDARNAAMAAERERLRKLDAATVAFVQPGDQAMEREFNYQSEPANRQSPRTAGRQNRGGAGWFSYDLPVTGTAPSALVVTYFNQPGQPAAGNFQILVDGTEIGKFAPNADANGFFDASYPVPAALVAGKAKVTVRFQAIGADGRISPVFGVRLIRG